MLDGAVAIGKARVACAQSFVAASNNRVHAPRSLYYCLFVPRIYIVALCAHPVRGESHIQCNANREVATTSLLFTMNRTDHTFL